MENENNKKEVWLHFIGANTYGKDRFIKEAQRIGVSRAIPLNMLSKMKWGDRIYTAEFNPIKMENIKKVGYADVFGYFTVYGFNHTLPHSIFEAILANTHTECGTAEPVTVIRACGSYAIAGSCFTKDALEDICGLIKQFISEDKTIQEMPKFFVTGRFTVLNRSIYTLTQFFRGFMKVPLDILETADTESTDVAVMNSLLDYQRKNIRGDIE